MPTVVLGVFPILLGIVFDFSFLFWFGNFMYMGGGGDQAMIIKALKYKPEGEARYQDHPTECGLAVFEKGEQ